MHMHTTFTATPRTARGLLCLALVFLWFAAQTAALWHDHDATVAHGLCAQCSATHLDDLIVYSVALPVALRLPDVPLEVSGSRSLPAAFFAHYAPRAPPPTAPG